MDPFTSFSSFLSLFYPASAALSEQPP
uniref:Uncharacterized protein n=1 Tax=Anguilla anguilla TaxID=7936 RepID=A0A0E9UL98_ANGAN